MQQAVEATEIANVLRNFSDSDKSKLVEIIADMISMDINDEKSDFQNILFRSPTNP